MGEVFDLDVHLRKRRNEVGKRLGFICEPELGLGQAVAGRTVEEVHSFGEGGTGDADGEDVGVPVGPMFELFGGEEVYESLPRKLETNAGDLGRKQPSVGIGTT